MKSVIFLLLLMLGSVAKAQNTFSISSTDVQGTCNSEAKELLAKRHLISAAAYCSPHLFPKLVEEPRIIASGNSDCQRIWAFYSIASGESRFECVQTKDSCQVDCSAHGLDFEYCHSYCGGW